MPTHNRVDLIESSIRSVLDQTFENFELLVVDNGSSDNTRSVVDGIGDPRIRYIYQENSGGPAGSRNTGIRESRGEFVAFLDSDDLWTRDKLARQVERFEVKRNLGMVYGQFTRFRNDGETVSQPIPTLENGRSGDIFEDLLLHNNFVPILTVMVRKSVMDEVGGFDEDPKLMRAEDLDLWLRVARVSEVEFLPKVLAEYRLHEGNLSGTRIHQCLAGLQVVDNMSDRDLIDGSVARRARSRILWQMGRAYAELDKTGLMARSMIAAFRDGPTWTQVVRFFYYLMPLPSRRSLRSVFPALNSFTQ